ncbi:MAG TPA: aminotransferase class V-fold PLP-dependent enzyme [Thermoanaerobaculales bacterium]|nr:aminotransferase class V-fold PLP-dependent enzyme [Thermoanaerobaculales bacterium]HPA79854.1 aminotransferase class V-fold PLP-dependent enzyme [Thermoanaerobaculales bacterium]HQL28778.1 aminotransferase class V-fold PLP-dependent enzyme [Thermoanaerobaculales bacterium]HQN96112.1 aminotransferase class V-fold PLP-dependent enzyme [Thermoanaerobaculales bacterium]HQP42666.1 aminotransferase class V-fold PLP-dependent enzyme [Thermoanaerobaculales bacterium]
MTDFVYLDNAATTFPKPPEVIREMCEFYTTRGVNPGRTGFDLALEAEQTVLQARQALAEFFGGTVRDRLVFSHNVTDALNLLIGSALSPGDHFITTCLEHNSVLRPAYQQAGRGVAVDFVPFDEHGYVHPEDIAARIKDNTRLVVMNHGSNVIGTIQPVAEVGRICRERGVLFAIDAAQTAGLVEIDVEAMSIDVVCFTGHKSLFGPTGTGGMYVAEHVDIWPCRSGGTGVKSALKTQVAEYPWRMEFGTLNTMGIAGLLAAQRWIAGRGGVAAIYEHEMRHARRLRDGLAGIDGVRLYCADMDRDHLPVFVFNIDGLPAGQAGELLDVEHDVITRTGLHCAPRVHEGIGTFEADGTVRFSPGVFTSDDDVERAIAAVADIANYARGRRERTAAAAAATT